MAIVWHSLLGCCNTDINLYVTHKGIPAFHIDADGYVVQPLKNTTIGQYPQVISLTAFGPGTYEWKVRIVGPEEDKIFWVGFGEEWSSNNATASIMVFRIGDITAFGTTVGGYCTITDISAYIDLTNLTTLKLIWISGASAALYVDGLIAATHITNIPSIPLYTFIEVHHSSVRAEHSMVIAEATLFNGLAKIE